MFRVDNFKFDVICQLIQVVASDSGSLSTAANSDVPTWGTKMLKIAPPTGNTASKFVLCLFLSVLCDGDLTVYVLISLSHKLGVNKKQSRRLKFDTEQGAR